MISELERTGERAIAADDDQAIDAAAGEHGPRAVADLAVVELLAPRRAEDRAALAQDAGDVIGLEREDRVVEQAAVAALDADDVSALGTADERRRPDRRVHPGCVASTGQDADAPGGRRHGSP
jgi:hypothetical protein